MKEKKIIKWGALFLAVFLGSQGLIFSAPLVQKTVYIKYVDPKIIQIQIRPMLTPEGKIEINTEKKEIYLTDTQENIEKIEKEIEVLDSPASVNQGKGRKGNDNPYPDIIEVKSMSASDMYSILKDIYGGQIGGNTIYSGSQGSEKVFKGPVKIRVLPGDKSLMVIANVDDNRKIREVIEKIETNKNVSAKKPHRNRTGVLSKVISLHNIPSSEAIEAINKLMGKDGGYRRENSGGSQAFSNARVDCLELKSNNAILVIGTPGDFEKVVQLINKMDSPPPQVLIEVTILEVSLTNGQSLGFEWGLDKGQVTAQNKYGLNDLLKANSPGFFIRVGNDYLQAVLNAIETNSDVKVLSSPHALVASNKKAVISIGDSVVINKESIEIPTANASNPIVKTTHEYVDVGLRLEIFPKVNDNGEVSIDIVQDVNDIKDSGVSGFPQISKRSLSTTVIAKTKELIVLGGLISRKTSVTDTKVPILGYLPVIGRLFRKSDSSVHTTELVLLLTPTIIRSQADIDEATQSQKNKMESIKKNFFSK